jgi:hypothetical protein
MKKITEKGMNSNMLPEFYDALRAWRDLHGEPDWRLKLKSIWMDAERKYPGVSEEHARFLDGLRRFRGPQWISLVQLPPPGPAWPPRPLPEHLRK